MANIEQAAKWMKEGKTVRRSKWSLLRIHASPDGNVRVIVDEDGEEVSVSIEGLLAEDWEIAH